MKKKIIMASLVLALALTASVAMAGPWGGRFYGMGPMVSSLTPEQSAKILALQQAHHEKVAPIQEELWKKKMELRGLWINPNPDQAKVSALQKEIFELIDKLQQESINLRAETLKVITSSSSSVERGSSFDLVELPLAVFRFSRELTTKCKRIARRN